jgi:hypothetical protein
MHYNYLEKLAEAATRKGEGEERSQTELESCANFPYREIVGSLNYLTRETRPDCMYATNLLSRFCGKHEGIHIAAVKRVLKYLRQDTSRGVPIGGGGSFHIRAMSDSDYAGHAEDRKSTTGYIIWIGESIIMWKTRRQASVAHSSTESEYEAATDTAKEIVYLRHLISELLPRASLSPSVLNVDNTAVIHLTKGARNKRTKHVAVRMFALAEWVKLGLINIVHIGTKKNHADILTKPSITQEAFAAHVDAIMT